VKKISFVCPACGKHFELLDITAHVDSQEDEEHVKLADSLNDRLHDAVTDAELDWVVEYCKEVK